MFGGGKRPAALLFFVGTAALAAGLALLTLSRSPSQRWEASRIAEGGRLRETFRFQPLGPTGILEDASSIDIPAAQPVLLLVFASTCPSCYANLDAWRETLRHVPEAIIPLGVALERDPRAASEYASRQLPSVTVVAPRDPRRFAAVFGVEKVPFTALVAGDGEVMYVRRGRLDSLAVRSLVEVLAGL